MRGTTKTDRKQGQNIPTHRPGTGGERNTVKHNEERANALDIQARMLAIMLRDDEDRSRYSGEKLSPSYGHRLKAYGTLRSEAMRLREGVTA